MTQVRDLELTSLERVLWPRTGFTKGDMVDYYDRVAPVLLPHIADRALTLGRFPGGVDALSPAGEVRRGDVDADPRLRSRNGRPKRRRAPRGARRAAPAPG